MLEGLAYLHNADVIHCDLKAANILTTKNGNVKLSDFGVSMNVSSKAMAEMKGDRSEVAGTPHWSTSSLGLSGPTPNDAYLTTVFSHTVAPEVIELKGPSPASDIWSLACTAIELLTGHPPYHEIHNGMSGVYLSSFSPPGTLN
jgi:serine/threonine protein kinase